MKALLGIATISLCLNSALALTQPCALKTVANSYFDRSDCEFSRRIDGQVEVSGETGSTVEFLCGSEKKLLILRRNTKSCGARNVLLDVSDIGEEIEGYMFIPEEAEAPAGTQ